MALATLAAAPRFENAGFVFRPLAVPSRGSTELAIWALEASAGAQSERHTVDREEVFVLHEGAVTFEVGEAVHEPARGDAVLVPPGVPLRLLNRSGAAARLTVCTSRGMRGTIGTTTIDPPWAQ